MKALAWQADFISVDGVRIARFTSGAAAPNAPALLLLHGLGHWTAGAWDRLVPLLDPAYRIVAIDLPGFGASDRPDVSYDLPFYRSILAGVAEQSLPARFVLCGHSLGAMIAADFAAEFPNRIAGLVLIAPAGFTSAIPGMVRLLASPLGQALFRRKPPRSFVRWTLLSSVVRREAIGEAIVARAFALVRDPAYRRAFARVYRAAAKIDVPALHRRFARYTGPALVVWGRLDRYVPFAGSGIARWVYPQARIEIFESSGHVVMLDGPERLAGAMNDLLRNGDLLVVGRG